MLALRWLSAAALIAALCIALWRFARTRTTSGRSRGAFARYAAHPSAVIALIALIMLYVLAALAPWLATHDPIGILAQSFVNHPPSRELLFGTDFAGRDVFSRVLYGTRISLTIALLATVISVIVGTAYGATAGFVGGKLDAVMMRFVDAFLAIPRIVLLIAIGTLWSPLSMWSLILILGLTAWFGTSRLVRAEVLSLKERDMVAAARALGARDLAIVRRHVLPNVMTPVIVAATLGVAGVIINEAALSYLGIGIPDPTPSLGNIIREGTPYVGTAWWVALFPGIALVLTALAYNLAGDGLRDAMDPRQVDR
ncbi:MAG: binding-protein-dependent transport system inner rane component [Gemmatimonadetes bacterium]|nr:binding-protein-dependent transport system inner rane component [Gemmatimonadota bacterium]